MEEEVKREWKWWWVSRRAYDLVNEQLARVQAERDSYRDRGDRLYDETILRFGYEAATPRVRQEIAAETVAAVEALAFDDPFGGLLDDEVERAVDEVVKTQQPS